MSTFNPSFQDISPTALGWGGVSSWFYSESRAAPDTISPYLAAHGFKPYVSIPYTVGGEFAGWLVGMNKTTFNHSAAINNLAGSFVGAYNEGREKNDKRYEDLLTNFDTLLSQHQTDIAAFIDDTITDADTGHITLLLSSVDLLDTDHDSFEADLDSYDSGDRDAELTSLKSTWKNAASTLESEYDTMTAGLDIPALIAEVDSAIDDLDSALTRFSDNHSGLAATLLSDYNSHDTTATAFLTDLGTTETARINEKWANSLTSETQQLANRGFYNSSILTDITARNTRENSEDIGQLNDRLNREKWENQHRLYEQKYRMRLGSLDADFRIIQGTAEAVTARLQHGQWSSKLRHEIAQLSINAKLTLLGLREKYYQFLLQSIGWQTDRRMKIYDALFRSRLEYLRVRQAVAGFHAELIRYQLDSKNQLAQAMFGIVERREDVYPGLGDVAALVTSLGDDS